MFNDQENKISNFPHYKLKISALTDGMLKSEALGLSFLSFHQTMINTEKSKIAMQKKKNTVAKANNFPPGDGNPKL